MRNPIKKPHGEATAGETEAAAGQRETVEAYGLSLQLYSRAGTRAIWYSCSTRGERDRSSTGYRDWDRARAWAKTYLRDLALRVYGGELVPPTGPLPLGDLFDLFRAKAVPNYKPGRKRDVEYALEVFEAVWGRDKDARRIAQSDVDTFIARRMAGGISVTLEDGEVRVRRAANVTTVHNNWRVLMRVMNWGTRERCGEGDDWLLESNPLKRLQPPPRPKSSQLQTPVATQRRYEVTLRNGDERTGRTRVCLILVRHQGWRSVDVRRLRWADVCLTPAQVRAALAEVKGLDSYGGSEDWAEHWPNGAVVLRDTKGGFDRVVPLHPASADALREYRRVCMAAGVPVVGTAYLFPKRGHPSVPVEGTTMRGWLRAAERRARKNGEELPRLKRGAWHAYRRLWRSERAGRRYERKTIAYAGLWTIEMRQAMDGGYFKLDPDEIQACVEARALTALPTNPGEAAIALLVMAGEALRAAGAAIPDAIQAVLQAHAGSGRAEAVAHT